MRHVLIVCYDFPRISAAGVIRTYAFAKNLPLFGWQPLLLTGQSGSPEEENIEASDGGLNCLKFIAATPGLLARFQENLDERQAAHRGAAVSNRNGIFKGAQRFASQLAVPDGKLAWLPRATRCALQVARNYPLKMCLSVSPRPTSHLVARRLRQSLGIPWVADLALPWSDAYWLSDRPRLTSWLDRRLESSVVRSAQHITVAYDEIARNICARHDRVGKEKISTIPTGYDDDLFEQQSFSKASRFTVVYPGNHFCEEGRGGEYFLKAIDEWIDSDPRLAAQVEFVFMGKWDEVLSRHRAAMAHPQVVRIEPVRSHRACIQTIMSAHMCILNTVGNRIPAKVYECMRSRKWIMALTASDSDLAVLLSHYSRGISIPPRDTFAIRHALHHIWQCSHAESPQATEAGLSLIEYSAKHSAEMMAHIFDALTVTRSTELVSGPLH
jgi:glycosyltransferase involved in cell wall biosynthesis